MNWKRANLVWKKCVRVFCFLKFNLTTNFIILQQKLNSYKCNFKNSVQLSYTCLSSIERLFSSSFRPDTSLSASSSDCIIRKRRSTRSATCSKNSASVHCLKTIFQSWQIQCRKTDKTLQPMCQWSKTSYILPWMTS